MEKDSESNVPNVEAQSEGEGVTQESLSAVDAEEGGVLSVQLSSGDNVTEQGEESSAVGNGSAEEQSQVDTDEMVEEHQEAFSAVLAPDREQIRRDLLAQAVVATNVRVVSSARDTQETNNNRRTKAIVALTLIIVVPLGFTLGFFLTERGNNSAAASSLSPTQAPTSSRFGEVAMLVESMFGTTSLIDSSSPQYQAAMWMADEDGMFTDLSTVEPDRFQQRYALAVFYFATGGPNSWIEHSFFLQTDVHECDWTDDALELVFSLSGQIGVVNCTEDQWVLGLELNHNNLTGTLPPEFGALSKLEDLYIIDGNIGGTLPRFLFELSGLRQLGVWFNEFTGTIPTEVGLATSLIHLGLYQNLITGTIPTEIGTLSSLQEITLRENFVTGTMVPKEILRLSSLVVLDFSGNALSGPLMPSFSNWPNLRAFFAEANELTGTIPNDLDNLPLFEAIDLGSNNLTGPFPSSIVSLSNVTAIGLDNNIITGTLPDDWNNLSRTLSLVNLNNNELSGSLPQSLGNVTSLQALWLNGNRFSGAIPSSMIHLETLRQLALQFNELTGDISFLCNGTKMLLPFLFQLNADCLEEVNCTCCNLCCDVNNACVEIVHQV